MSYIAGIDLAWRPEKNESGWAVGRLDGGTLTLDCLETGVLDVPGLALEMSNIPDLSGIAVDAPLVVRNETGRRPCEAELSGVYQGRGAGCHPSNLSLYPDLASVRFARDLERAGFVHLGQPFSNPWLIEIYPHPALIEIFGLPERLRYKKGAVHERRAGQQRLARLILGLAHSPVLPLEIPDPQVRLLEPDHIDGLAGAALKRNEDALDAIACLYIAGLYAMGCPRTVFGDREQGYIVVPTLRCDGREARATQPVEVVGEDGDPAAAAARGAGSGETAAAPAPAGEPAASPERVEQLLSLLARAARTGRPLLCTEAWAYRRLIGPVDRWSPLASRRVRHEARKSSQRVVPELGLVHLDTFIVSPETGRPDERHWSTAPYTLPRWQAVFDAARVLGA